MYGDGLDSRTRTQEWYGHQDSIHQPHFSGHSRLEDLSYGGDSYSRHSLDRANHLGVSAEDWNEARAELATLGQPRSGWSADNQLAHGHGHSSYASDLGRFSPTGLNHSNHRPHHDYDSDRASHSTYLGGSHDQPRDALYSKGSNFHHEGHSDWGHPSGGRYGEYSPPFSSWDNDRPHDFVAGSTYAGLDDSSRHQIDSDHPYNLRNAIPEPFTPIGPRHGLDGRDKFRSPIGYRGGSENGDYRSDRLSSASGWENGLASPSYHDTLHTDSRLDSERLGDVRYSVNPASPAVFSDPYYKRSLSPASDLLDSRLGLHDHLHHHYDQSDRGSLSGLNLDSEWTSTGRRNQQSLDNHLHQSYYGRSADDYSLGTYGSTRPNGIHSTGRPFESPVPSILEHHSNWDRSLGHNHMDDRSFLKPHRDSRLSENDLLNNSTALPHLSSDLHAALRNSFGDHDRDRFALERRRASSPGYLAQRDRIDEIRAQLDDSLARSSTGLLDSHHNSSHIPTRPITPLSSISRARSPYQHSFLDPRSVSRAGVRTPNSTYRDEQFLSLTPALSHQSNLDDQLDKIDLLDHQIRLNEQANQRELALTQQKVSQLSQQSISQAINEAEIFRELDRERREIDRERAELLRGHDEAAAYSQISHLNRQIQEIDRQREIDRNRQLANLSRFGHLPSVLKGNYDGRPLASPYLQQSKFLSTARKISDRDPARRRLPVFDHVDAYYRLMSDHLPHHLPMFKDPYSFGSSMGAARAGLNLTRPKTRLGSMFQMGNPFEESIDYDYGYGKVGRLGLKPDRFAREQAYILDDLYLYELLLQLDRSISDLERRRRWSERLRWEELLDNRAKVQAWKTMSSMERRELGLGEGSFWASSLFGIPLCPQFGYSIRPDFNGLGSLSTSASRTHYGLTPGLVARYPMWSRGGLGLGRRISSWYDTYRPIKLKYLQRQEEIRREYAERRGEIPPRPRLKGVGLMGTGVPGQPLLGLRGFAALSGPNSGSRSLTKSIGRMPPLATRPPSLSTGSTSRIYPQTLLPPRTHTLTTPLKPSVASIHTPQNLRDPVLPHPIRQSSKPTQSLTPFTSTTSSRAPLTKINSNPIPLKSTTYGISSGDSVYSQTPLSTDQHKFKNTTNFRSSTDVHSQAPSRPRTPNGGVVFNPNVKSIAAETLDAPLPEPRPPSRASMRPPRSAMKTPPPDAHSRHRQPSTSLSLEDEERLESITRMNTNRNRSTPALPEDRTKGSTRTAN